MDPVLEAVPVRFHDVPPCELTACGQGELVEVVLVDLLEGGADDVHVGEQTGVEEPEQPGKELAAGQVPGGPEQDDHMGQQDR